MTRILYLLTAITDTVVVSAGFQKWWVLGVVGAICFLIIIIILIICSVRNQQGEKYYGELLLHLLYLMSWYMQVASYIENILMLLHLDIKLCSEC